MHLVVGEHLGPLAEQVVDVGADPAVLRTHRVDQQLHPDSLLDEDHERGPQPGGREPVDAGRDPPHGARAAEVRRLAGVPVDVHGVRGEEPGQVLAGVHRVADGEDVLGLAAGLEPVEHAGVQLVGDGAGADADHPPLVGGAGGQPAARLEQPHHLRGDLGCVLGVDVLEDVVGDDQVEGAVVVGERLARRHDLRLVERRVGQHRLVDVGADHARHPAAQHPQPPRDRRHGVDGPLPAAGAEVEHVAVLVDQRVDPRVELDLPVELGVAADRRLRVEPRQRRVGLEVVHRGHAFSRRVICSMSASTISRASRSALVSAFQPSTSRALEGSPIRASTSVGRSYCSS